MCAGAYGWPISIAQAMHHCAVKFPDVAGTVIHLLMDFLSDSNSVSALDVIVFVREILETNPKLHDTVLERLLDNFGQISSLRVSSCALWIFGECVPRPPPPPRLPPPPNSRTPPVPASRPGQRG